MTALLPEDQYSEDKRLSYKSVRPRLTRALDSLTQQNTSSMVEQMPAQRPRLSVDMSPRLMNAIKAEAYGNGMTAREFVLRAIAKQSPKLKQLVDEELN